jgi:class I fructose-bisphosphate aldolase
VPDPYTQGARIPRRSAGGDGKGVLAMTIDEITRLLGDEADELLGFDSPRVPRESLCLPGPDWVSRVHGSSDRPAPVLRSLETLFSHGRLAGTGYLSILPVDQGIEHSAGASFAPNPMYFDPENIVRFAIEAGCNAVVSTMGVLGQVARKYAHRIMFASVEQAFEMGAVAVGATVYFGSEESDRQITEVSQAFEAAHGLGMACVLWCYVRNEAFTIEGKNYETSADLTGQANHLGASLGADIIKQKAPTLNGGYLALNSSGASFGKYDQRMYGDLCSDNPIDMTRYQVLNCFNGRVGFINSGGGSGKDDLADVVRLAVINKRAGGMGLISGRKTFQKPMAEGVKLFEAIQGVYLNEQVTVA